MEKLQALKIFIVKLQKKQENGFEWIFEIQGFGLVIGSFVNSVFLCIKSGCNSTFSFTVTFNFFNKLQRSFHSCVCLWTANLSAVD